MKKSETLKRKGVNGVNDGAAKKRVKKAKAGVVATCSRPEISASDVVATVGVVEDVEDAVVGTESGELPDVAGENTLAPGEVVNGVVLWDGDSNSNAECSVGSVIDQNAQVIDLLISEFVASPAYPVEKSKGASPWKRWAAGKAGLVEEGEDGDELNSLLEALVLSEEAARAYDVVFSDLQASAEGHAQDEFEHQRKKLTMSKELSDLKGSYHALSEKFDSEKTEMLRVRSESEEKF